jgi:antitoxin YefM
VNDGRGRPDQGRTCARPERIEITRNGRRAAVLLGADDDDALGETIAVLSDPEFITAHVQRLHAVEAGDVLDADQLTELLPDAGRLPRSRS